MVLQYPSKKVSKKHWFYSIRLKTYKNKTINDSFDLCEIFLNEAHVATIPGDGFGAPGYVRFSYAIDKKTIKNGIERIEKIIFEIK